MKDIAIIAYSGVFPEAASVEEFAQNLKAGKSAIGKVSESRLKDTALPVKDIYVNAGYLEDITHFDHQFFDISLGEAEEITPHQRLLLQEAHKTFEQAGYRLKDLKGSNTSVYVGDAPTEYYHLARKGTPTLVAGNLKSINAGRISRFFDLRGAAISVDTACSSTLTAISLAYKDLILKETDLALVCGVNILVFPNRLAADGVLGIDSPTGECRPFSAQANGTLDGEIVSCILLKSLDQAMADKDTIHGVIKGIALNQDAGLSASIMAPSSVAQADVIKKALAKTDVNPAEVTFVEAHGTGTKLGDPIEVEGLGEVFSKNLKTDEKIYLSAIKSNIGHTDSAAGLAGVIKVLLSFKHNTLFPSVNAFPANEFIDFEEAKVKVLAKATSWDEVKRSDRKVAGVSSFGLMGTNGHIVLEDIQKEKEAYNPTEDEESQAFVFGFSAKSKTSLQAYLQEFANFALDSKHSLAALSFAQNTQKEVFGHRLVLSASSREDLALQLRSAAKNLPANAKKEGPAFLLFDEMPDWDIDSLKEAIKSLPALNIPVEQCTTVARASLLLQYHSYQLLKDSSLPLKDMIGIGLGKLLIKILKKEITLEAALDLADAVAEQKENPEDLRKRAMSLIARYEQQIHFISLGHKGPLAKAFEQQSFGGQCTFGFFGYTKHSALNECLKTLFQLNATIDPRVLYASQKQKNIVLPAYVFDKKRCWLRTVDDVFSFDGAHETVSEEAPVEEKVNLQEIDLLQHLQKLWSDILKTEVGADDDFFDHGGHSLNGQQLIIRINEACGTDFDIDTLFDYGTPAEMEEYINTLELDTPIVQKEEKAPVAKVQKAPAKEAPVKKLGIIQKLSEKIKVDVKQVGKTIPKIETNTDYAISGAQNRMWILSQFEESSLAYNLPNMMELKGDFEIDCFKKALNAVVERHEILRTIFRENEKGEVRQWILSLDEINFKIDYKDFRKREQQQVLVDDYVAYENSLSFDLQTGPLLKAALLHLEDQHYIFYYNMHHIISDGWSMGVLVKDVMAYYEAFKANEKADLPKLRIQYKDYTVWHNEQLSSGTVKKHQGYWLEQLSGELPILELPSSKTRPAIMTNNVQVLRTYLSKDITEKLQAFSRGNRGSLFMSLLAAWNVLLYRYSNQKDIIIGTPVAGRGHSELENQIGCYINTLALRNQVDPHLTFAEFFQQIKTTTLAAYAHQVYPFEQLVEDLDLQRDMSRNAVFDVLLVLQNTGEKLTDLNLTEKEVHAIQDLGSGLSIFDIEIIFEEMDDYLSFTLNYNTDIYDGGMIESMIKHFKRLLDNLLAHPEATIEQSDYLLAEEQQQLLVDFNPTPITYPKDKTVSTLFQEQARKTPDCQALVFGETKLDYQTLDNWTNQFAAFLIDEFDVTSNDLIGVKMERSEWMVIAMMAILKSGAAYVPIDVDYPQERIQHIEKDSQCRMTIDEKVIARFKAQQSHYSNEPIDVEVRATDLAYVMYTSGSTGNPKGVMVEHQNVNNLIYWFTDRFDINEKTVALQLTSISFDPSVEDIFGTLSKGGCYHVVSKDILLDVQQLRKYIKTHGVSILNSVPNFLFELLGDQPKLESLLTVISGGDKLSNYIKDKLLATGYKLYNNYGPTETTVDALCSEVSAAKVNVGQPIANTRVYILNERLELLPFGFIGKLFVAGAGVARGYLNQPELTESKFMENPFVAGERMYDTGDWARWLPGGHIDFIGRKDNQVKIRGHRIELGEIENAIQQFSENIADVVVVAKEMNQEKTLVAYNTSNKEVDKSDLRNYLKEQLPEYMVPEYFVALDVLPFTANGKIDLDALPDVSESDLTKKEYLPPRNHTEAKLVNIWENILSKEQIGVNDNFFELGGNSMKIMKMIYQIKHEFDLDINPKTVFENTTTEALAAHISFATTQVKLASHKNNLIEIEL